MKNNTKAILCLAAMVLMLVVGVFKDLNGYENMVTGWLMVFALGLGWYANGEVTA